MNQSYANGEVLEFYRGLPFNYSSDIRLAAAELMSLQEEIIRFYVPLDEEILLRDQVRVLDLGCGTGWLAALLARYYGCSVTGVDFNPQAIEQARRINEALGGDGADRVHFEVADLFLFEAPPFDLVMSHGVLHHTDNCRAGIRKACSLTRVHGHLIVGLYHDYGRRLFLDYFRRLRSEQVSEEELFQIYRKLDPRHAHDEVLARSWFQDQVFHPHETQHTVGEVAEVFRENGVIMTATSIDGYASRPNPDLESILKQERGLREVGERYLQEGRYYPGYFVVAGERLK